MVVVVMAVAVMAVAATEAVVVAEQERGTVKAYPALRLLTATSRSASVRLIRPWSAIA